MNNFSINFLYIFIALEVTNFLGNLHERYVDILYFLLLSTEWKLVAAEWRRGFQVLMRIYEAQVGSFRDLITFEINKFSMKFEEPPAIDIHTFPKAHKTQKNQST